MKLMSLKCPLCNHPLNYQSPSWTCGRHFFDMAKEGYVNLCIPPIKGDDALLVQSREHFFLSNPYEPLMKEIMKWIKNDEVVIDVGCGIGAYTKYFKTYNNSLLTLGCDGSKIAIKRAAKRDTLSQYVVANMNNLPFLTQSADVVISVFAPFELQEIKRVLKSNGRFIIIQPAPNHLFELKQLIYDEVRLNPTHSNSNVELKLLSEETITFNMSLEHSQLLSLFQMTPYAYKSPNDAIKRINECSQLDVTASFVLQVFQK
jgi:23S rRNA (guanine745-N1)-methyltransferase